MTTAITTSGSVLPLVADTDGPLFRISLAQWTINPQFKSGELDNLEFARVAAEAGYEGLEYVNQFFMDKALDAAYLGEMKQRAEDAGIESLLIMCDREGNLGDPEESKRNEAVENHRKWLEAAKFLGCHSIRVNAYSSGTWQEQVARVADGLSQLTAFGAEMDLNVIVENHGGLSSNGKWIVEVMEQVQHERCGTLPDFGNFKIADGESYDSYRGIEEMMPYAKGVSVKNRGWNDEGKPVDVDFVKMLDIVLASGFRGFCGVEYGGFEGLKDSRKALEAARSELSANY